MQFSKSEEGGDISKWQREERHLEFEASAFIDRQSRKEVTGKCSFIGNPH